MRDLRRVRHLLAFFFTVLENSVPQSISLEVLLVSVLSFSAFLKQSFERNYLNLEKHDHESDTLAP